MVRPNERYTLSLESVTNVRYQTGKFKTPKIRIEIEVLPTGETAKFEG